MVAVIHKRAHSVVANLNYNLKKIDAGTARIVETANLPDGADINPAIISKYMRHWERRSQRMEKTAFHMSVDPSYEDNASMSKETILEYINGLMAHLGYADQPYIVVEHNDIERRHYHVVSVRVNENGKGIPTHMDGTRVKEYSIANQERFGFVYGKDPLAEERNINIHSRFEKGRGRIKAQIEKYASGILRCYSFSTQSQFAKIMRHYGIKAEWKRKDDTSILMCQGLDNQGCADTRPVVLQQPLTRSIIAACSRKEKNNDENRKAALQRLKDAYYESSSIDALQKKLAVNNVELLLERTKDGSKIFGVTLIDYHTRSVFKGSDLDKALMNDIKAGIFRPRPIETKIYDPWELAREVARKFTALTGYDAIMKPGVFGLVVQDGEVILSYGGKKFIGMQPNSSNMTLYSRSAEDFADKLNCSNIYSFIDEAKKYVLSDNNIARAKAPAVKYDNADTIRNPQQTRRKL